MTHHHGPPEVLNPFRREDFDEMGQQVVGHWESIPARTCICCCVLDIAAAFNTYAPANDGDPYVTEMESTGTCCFCLPVHQFGLSHSNPERMIRTEKTIGPPSRDMTFVPVHAARDAEGTLVINERGTGYEDGRPTTATQEWRFSRVRDATMTWEQQTPNRMAVEFRKVSRMHAPMSERFRSARSAKMQLLQQLGDTFTTRPS